MKTMEKNVMLNRNKVWKLIWCMTIKCELIENHTILLHDLLQPVEDTINMQISQYLSLLTVHIKKKLIVYY